MFLESHWSKHGLYWVQQHSTAPGRARSACFHKRTCNHQSPGRAELGWAGPKRAGHDHPPHPAEMFISRKPWPAPYIISWKPRLLPSVTTLKVRGPVAPHFCFLQLSCVRVGAFGELDKNKGTGQDGASISSLDMILDFGVRNLRVVFDSPELNSPPVYSSGDVVSGKVLLELTGETKVHSLKLHAEGFARVHWTESRSAGASSAYTQNYSDEVEYLNHREVLLQAGECAVGCMLGVS